MLKKILEHLNPARVALLASIIFASVAIITEQTYQSAGGWTTNSTIQFIEETTKMPFPFFSGLIILAIGLFVYLWILAGKEIAIKIDSKQIDMIADKIAHKVETANKPLFESIEKLINEIRTEREQRDNELTLLVKELKRRKK